MNKLLNRIKYGPSLLVLLLISLSFYSSLTTKPHHTTTSLKKSSRPVRSLPNAVIEFETASESESAEVNVKFTLPDSLKTVFFNSSRTVHRVLSSFTFIKVPLLFFLFDIPPPTL